MSPQYSQNPRFGTKGTDMTGGMATRAKTAGQAVDRSYPDVAHNAGAAPHQGEMICAGCHAVYAGKHWNYDDDRYKEMKAKGAATTECPGCRQIALKQYEGELTMLASPPVDGIDERRQRLFEVESLARARDPKARIGEVRVEQGRWQVLTTSARLAERLGKELQKAFGGELTVDKLEGEIFSRVVWAEGPKHVA